ncbi:MAG: hypothetical protein NVS9B10_06220 [Nevskia sp.]
MLALKLLLVPGFVALVSLAGRRWGPGVAGWLAGFPVVAGSILFVLALEHGAGFAAAAASGSLPAVFASVTFSLVYSHVCRHRPWTIASPAALGAWALASFGLSLLPAALPLGLAIALVTLLLSPHLFPRVALRPLPNRFDRRELLLRMAAGAALTLVVSALAEALGPARSGILSLFPVIGAVLSVFSQRLSGAAFVVLLLRSMVRGLYSFVAFCVALPWLLAQTQGNLALGFGGAALAAVAVQGLLRRSPASTAGTAPR